MAFAHWTQIGHTRFERRDDMTVRARAYRVAEPVAESDLPQRGARAPWLSGTDAPGDERVLDASGRHVGESFEVTLTTYALAGTVSGSFLTLRVSPVSGEETHQVVFDATLACLPATASPAWGTAFDPRGYTDVRQAKLVSLRRTPNRWPGLDAIEARYVGGTGAAVAGAPALPVSTLRASYRRRRTALRRWEAERSFELTPANLATVENDLMLAVDSASYPSGYSNYIPRCTRTEAHDGPRDGMMTLTAFYETLRSTQYATIEFQFSAEQGPLPYTDLTSGTPVQLWGPLPGNNVRGARQVVRGFESMPQGKSLVVVKSAFDGEFDPAAFMLGRLWHVNSAAVTVGTDPVVTKFDAGELLLMGGGLTRTFKRGGLWYVNYVFGYDPCDPDGWNSLTKVSNFVELMLREAVFDHTGNVALDEDGEPLMRTVLKSVRGFIEDNELQPDVGDLDTVLFPEHDITTLMGKVRWDETPYED